MKGARAYPFISGPCKNCAGDIVIKRSREYKPNRVFCSLSCLTSYRNKTRIWTADSRAKLARWHRGKPLSADVRRKLSEALKGHPGHTTGMTFGEEHRAKKRAAMIAHYDRIGRKTYKRSYHTTWTPEYKTWRESVFERDNHTCRGCRKAGGYLQADHIKPWATHPELRFDPNNGQTLCVPCHKAKTRVDIRGIYA